MTKIANSKDAVIILNPVSGQGDPTQRKQSVMQIARSFGWRGTLVETTKTISATTLAKRVLNNGAKYIIVGGGDGTIMEVIQAIVKKDVVLGILPLGTGNLFAQNLGIPLTLIDACEVAMHGKVIEIDVARANDTYFSIIAGVGLDAEVMRHTKRKIKDMLGVWAYILSGIQRLFNASQRYTLVLDKKKKIRVRARSILVANMARITGSFQAVPTADPRNGTLRIGVVKARRMLHWGSILFHTIRGAVHESPHYDLLEGEHVEIRPLKGLMVYQCDGNAFPPTDRLTIMIYPSAISVACPKKPLL